MDDPERRRVLVVANRTAGTPRLLQEVQRRARAGSCSVTRRIPDATDRRKADRTLEQALPLLERAAGSHVEGVVGGSDPLAAVQRAVREGSFDEIIVSTLPRRISAWLRRDLVHRIGALGLPVTAVEAEREPALAGVGTGPGPLPGGG